MVEEAMSLQARPWQQLVQADKNNRLSHAYVMDGLHGTGKTRLTLTFIQYLLCEQRQSDLPCQTCSSCRRIENGNHPNIWLIQKDGQSIKKEQIDELIQQMSKKGYEKGRRFYMIEEAHTMTVSAANALLKFLEEPVGEITAFLMTDTYAQLLPTIQSRCQRIQFTRPNEEQLIGQLVVDHQLTDSLASTLSRITANVDEALSLSQEEQFMMMRKLALQLIERVEQSKAEAILFIQGEWQTVVKEKEDLEMILNLLLHGYRDIVTIKVNIDRSICYPDARELLEKLSYRLTYEQLSSKIDEILHMKQKISSNMNRTLLVEQLILRL